MLVGWTVPGRTTRCFLGKYPEIFSDERMQADCRRQSIESGMESFIQLELVKLFVKCGADLSATFGPRPKIDVIRFATENGSQEILQFLKEHLEKNN